MAPHGTVALHAIQYPSTKLWLSPHLDLAMGMATFKYWTMSAFNHLPVVCRLGANQTLLQPVSF